MSGPRKTRRGLWSRRRFLRSSLFSTVAAGAPMLGAQTTQAADRAQCFMHGVASGDPLSDRVIIWTRVSVDVAAGTKVAVDYQLARDPGLQDLVRSGTVMTGSGRDYTVKIDVKGLQPGTTYYYRFSCDGQASPVGRTRTLPTGRVDHLRIAVACCSSLAHGYFNAYRCIAQRQDLDLVVHLGDYIYEYGSGQYGDLRAYEPAHEILSLTDYRQRHAQYKRDPDLQALHRQHPMVNIWDDHETANNAWRDGAENHNAGEGDWAQRVSAALRAYYEWIPMREPDPAVPRRDYRSFQLGDLVELTMLEERLLARDLQTDGLVRLAGANFVFAPIGNIRDTGRQLLGADQEAWLASTLRSTPARWKLIGQGVMFGQLKLAGLPEFTLGGGVYVNPDQWDGYPAARQRVFDILAGDARNAGIDNVVVLTGDIHCAWSMDLSPDPSNPLPLLGGYNALSGKGSRAVEFVATSVTSPGLDQLAPLTATLRVLNPHIKYSNLKQRGYLLLDVTPERVVGEHWFVQTVAQSSTVETLGAAYQTRSGANHLSKATQTQPRSNPPPFAP